MTNFLDHEKCEMRIVERIRRMPFKYARLIDNIPNYMRIDSHAPILRYAVDESIGLIYFSSVPMHCRASFTAVALTLRNGNGSIQERYILLFDPPIFDTSRF